MRALGGNRTATRQNARDDHQALGTGLFGVGSQRHRACRILRASADNDRNAGLDQALHAFHALLVGEQRPVTHGAAIDDGAHT